MTARGLIVSALAVVALIALTIGLVPGGSLQPVDGHEPDAKLLQAVLLRAPDAQRISYFVRSGPGIPDPSPPDEANVEFDQGGVTCVADVSDFSSDRPVIDEPTCPSVGLQTWSDGPRWDRLKLWLAVAAVFAALAVAFALLTREADEVATAGHVQ